MKSIDDSIQEFLAKVCLQMHCGTFKCFEMHGISSYQQNVKKTEGKYYYRLIRMKEMKR